MAKSTTGTRSDRAPDLPLSPSAALDGIAGGIVFVAALAVYMATLHPGLPAGDSGELIAVAHTLGVAHPPGYPLYTMLAHVWDRLVPFGSVAHRLNLLSAVCMAAAAAVIAATACRLARRAPKGAGRGESAVVSVMAGVVAGTLAAFAIPPWKYALVAEVFAMNALLAACALALVVDLVERLERRGEADLLPPLAGLAFLLTLALSHHHTLVLLVVPALGFGVFLAGQSQGRNARFQLPRRTWIGLALALLLGLLPLLYLPIASARRPTVAWGDTASPSGFVRHLMRADYGTFQLDPERSGLRADRSHVALFLESLPRDLGVVGLVLVLAGAVALALDRRRRLLGLVLAGYFVLQLLFFTRVGFPTVPAVYLGVVERFYILPDIVLALLAGAGAAAALQRVPGALGLRSGSAIALVLLLVSTLVPAHWSFVDQRGNRFTEDLGRDLLASAPGNAVVFVQGDVFHNSLAYLQNVEHARPDVTVFDQELLTYSWYVATGRRRAPGALPPRLGTDDHYDGTAATGIVTWLDHLNGKRPALFLGLKDQSYVGRYVLETEGFLAQAYPLPRTTDARVRADSALARFMRLRLDAGLRRYDPWSFEEQERLRLVGVATQTSLWLCAPELLHAPYPPGPGLDSLLAFVARSRAAEASGLAPDREFVRARGYLNALQPATIDSLAAEQDLSRALAAEPSGPRADEVKNVQSWLRRGPVAVQRLGTP